MCCPRAPFVPSDGVDPLAVVAHFGIVSRGVA